MKSDQVWEKFELYILSLWLLFFLIIVVTVDIPYCFGTNCEFIGWGVLIGNNKLSLISLFFLVLGLIFYLRFDYKISGSSGLPSAVVKIEDVNYEHLTFLTTYIIPLICFNLTSSRYIFALVFLLVIIGIIYVRTDKFYANPTLAVLGFRLYKVSAKTRSGTQDNLIIIIKGRLSENDKIRMFNLDEKVCFARRVS
jgi:hypothetical protein